MPLADVLRDPSGARAEVEDLRDPVAAVLAPQHGVDHAKLDDAVPLADQIAQPTPPAVQAAHRHHRADQSDGGAPPRILHRDACRGGAPAELGACGSP